MTDEIDDPRRLVLVQALALAVYGSLCGQVQRSLTCMKIPVRMTELHPV